MQNKKTMKINTRNNVLRTRRECEKTREQEKDGYNTSTREGSYGLV